MQYLLSGPETVCLEIYQSNGTFSAIRSAISYAYKSVRVVMPDDMSKELSLFINGMQ